MYVHGRYVCDVMHLIKKGKKDAVFKSIKKWKNRENAAAYPAERLVPQETFFKLKNPRLINKSILKLRVVYNGVRTVTN